MNKIFLALLLALLVGTCLQPSVAQEQKIVDKVIAKIDNHIVLKSDLDLAVNQLSKQNNNMPVPERIRCQIFQQLIINKMLLAKAEIDTIKPSDNEVQSQLDRRMDILAKQVGGESKIEMYIGKTAAQLKEEYRPGIVEQLTLQKMQQELSKDIKITPRQVKNFFARMKDSLPEASQEVQIAVLIKVPTVNKTETSRVKQLLLGFREDVLAGRAEFEELASKYSEDLGSKEFGGDLGWRGRGVFVPPFEAAALKLKAGEISDPVESDFGIHLIQLIERRGNLFHARHILVRPKPSTEDLKAVYTFMDSLRKEIINNKISFEKAASLYSDDKMTKMRGGMMTSEETGEITMSIDNLETGLYTEIKGMKVGDISLPSPYRTQDGQEGYRMIFLKKSNPPHKLSLETDYPAIYQMALNEERGMALEKWFQKTKKELFIDIDSEFDKCEILKNL
jgi:peptidyl-prolyl cis-trans isomerase SurA